MNIGDILIWESSNLLSADSRRDRAGDAGVLVPGKGAVHGAGLAPALWIILDASQILSLTPLIAWWKNAPIFAGTTQALGGSSMIDPSVTDLKSGLSKFVGQEAITDDLEAKIKKS